MQIFLLLHKLEHITTTGISILKVIPIYSTFVGVALVHCHLTVSCVYHGFYAGCTKLRLTTSGWSPTHKV